MVRYLSACALSMMLVVSSAHSADLPMSMPRHAHVKQVKKYAHKLASKKPIAVKVATSRPKLIIAKPAPLKAPVVVGAKPAPDAAALEKIGSINLSWTLDPLVANADGGKNEGSASVSGNLVIDRPGQKFGPQLTIELIGHIVKTPQSVVRLDIQIGSIKRTVTWDADVTKSGTFKIILDEKVPVGVLPDTLPASALAFVTKDGEGRAAMISLEKINLRVGKLRIAGVDDE